MVERVFNKQAFAHSVETPCVFSLFFFFSFCPKRYLNVNFDDTVEGKKKTKTGLSSVQWKVTLAQMDQKKKKKKEKSRKQIK